MVGREAAGVASPALSVVTVCRDVVRDIEDTCRSVANQTFRDFEWIVVDGASTDGTRSVLEKYRTKMAHFVSEPDGGVYHAMNKGIRLARGEYVLFLNGGDYLAADDVLENVFRDGLGGDVNYGYESLLDPATGRVEPRMAPPASAKIDKSYFVLGILYHQSTFFRRELFARFGLYDESYRVVADWEKCILFFVRGCSFRRVERVVSVFRRGGLSFREDMGELLRGERRRVHERHYSRDELRAALGGNGYRRLYSLLCIFTIAEKYHGAKVKYSLFGVPLLSVVGFYRERCLYLLGCIRVFTVREQSG